MKNFHQIASYLVLITIYFSACNSDDLPQIDSYCDANDLFIEQISTPNLLSEYIPYCTNCPDENGNPVTLNVMLHTPVDDYNEALPLRPHVLVVHGYLSPLFLNLNEQIYGAQFANTRFAQYGFSASAIEYRQNVAGIMDSAAANGICTVSEEEVVKTHYRSIQDLRKAIDFLWANSAEYGIDTSNFFLFGNSMGGIVSLTGMFVEDEHEWISTKFPEYGHLTTSLDSWAPRHDIKGIISIAGAIYDSEFIEASEDIPLFLGHGVCDTVAPYKSGTFLNCPTTDIIISGSYNIACQLESLGKPYSLHNVLNLNHAWPQYINDQIEPKARAWLKEQLICGTPIQESFIYQSNEFDCGTVSVDLMDCNND